MNLYGFANGDPVNYRDPFGLCAGPAIALCIHILRTAIVGTAAFIGAKFAADAAKGTVPIYVDPDEGEAAAEHGREAQAAGNPTSGVIDRAGADARRKERLRDVPTAPGMDRDEYPPAVVKPDASGVSIKHIPSRDNRRSGSSIGRQIRGLPDGTPVDLIIGKKPKP